MTKHFRCLVWFCLLWISPFSFGQVITIRIINGKNGRPLSKQRIPATVMIPKDRGGGGRG
jgi:hypothetical protein